MSKIKWRIYEKWRENWNFVIIWTFVLPLRIFLLYIRYRSSVLSWFRVHSMVFWGSWVQEWVGTWTPYEQKIWIDVKFRARAIWNQPRAGNWARTLKLIVRPPQNQPKLRKWENREKHAKTSGFIDFSTSNMHFRSADAANHLNGATPGSRRD